MGCEWVLLVGIEVVCHFQSLCCPTEYFERMGVMLCLSRKTSELELLHVEFGSAKLFGNSRLHKLFTLCISQDIISATFSGSNEKTRVGKGLINEWTRM